MKKTVQKGSQLSKGCYALTAREYDPATAADFIQLPYGNEVGVYRLDELFPLAVSASRTEYDANGAVLLAPHGIAFQNCSGLTVKNLTVVGGPIRIEDSSDVTLVNVTTEADCCGVIIDEASRNVFLRDCRIEAKNYGVKTAGRNTAVYASYIRAAIGLADAQSSRATTVQNCVIEATETAVLSNGTDFAARANTITAPVGVSLGEGASCALVALNVISGGETSVSLSGAFNSVVLLNDAVAVTAENCRALYVCENTLTGTFTAKNNNYLLANANEMANAPVLEGNENTNGDTVTDINHRAEVGADEALLPHTDREKFVGMPRKFTVRDVEAERELGFNEYIQKEAAENEIVIVAPGAYSQIGGLTLIGPHANTTIYAYGVYSERQSGAGFLYHVGETENITLKGLTMGYRIQSTGQVYLLKKLGDGKLLVRTGAGHINEFGGTCLEHFNRQEAIGAQKAGVGYAWCDAHYTDIVKNEDGTMTMTVGESFYSKVDPGDIFTCRMKHGGHACSVYKSSHIVYEDFTLYANAGGLAFFEGQNKTVVTYHRVHNTIRNADIIDQKTYDYFKGLEAEYGISFEMSVDDKGRLRGSPCHIGSIDATHVSMSSVGSRIISTIFDNMCDDGTNQKGLHARLSSLVDNGDGTTTVTFRGNYSKASEVRKTRNLGYCHPIAKGNRVFIYNSKGKLVCDTPALTDQELVGTAVHEIIDKEYNIFTVKIKTEDVNFEAIRGFDLLENSPEPDNKVLVDNMSFSSNGCYFENSVVANNRSRGYLIKASDVTVKNCTFRNVGMGGVAILYEIFWGESGITENMEVKNNLFDHTGFFNPECDFYAAVSIHGMGESVDEDYLLYKNINIEGNKIVNRVTKYGVFVNSARDITIRNNDFGVRAGESEENPSIGIHINGAMNVEIAGNTFSPYAKRKTDGVYAIRNKNIWGSDVEEGGVSLIPDSEA